MKIPTHTAGKLASEVTGVNTLDKSGMVVAEAMTSLATKIQGVAEQHQALQRQAELVKLNSQYASEYTVGAAEIRSRNRANPDEAVKELGTFQAELASKFKSQITDPDVALRFDASATDYGFQEKTRTQLWAMQEKDKLIQKNLADSMNTMAVQAANSENLDAVLDLTTKMKLNQQTFLDSWGEAEGSRIVAEGQESLLNAYFVNKIEEGKAFQVLKELQNPRLNPIEYSWADGRKETSAPITPEKRAYVEKIAKSALLKANNDAATLSLIDAVTQGFDVQAEQAKPLPTLMEEVNELSFNIGKMREMVKDGAASEEQVKVMEDLQALKQKAIEFRVQQSDDRIVPSPEAEAKIGAMFDGLFRMKGQTRKSFKGTLEQVFEFRKALEDNRSSIDPKNYERWQYLVQKAFQSDINGFTKSRFGTKRQFEMGPIKLGALTAKDPAALTSSKKLQDTLQNAISKYTGPDETLYDSFFFFMDELDERGALKDDTVLSMMPQKDVDGLMSLAQRKATLKKMGLPLYMEADDIVTRGNKQYRITGFSNGRVEVEEK